MRAILQHHLRCSLHKYEPLSILAHNCRHALLGGRERIRPLVMSRILIAHGFVILANPLHKPHQSMLSFVASHPNHLAVLIEFIARRIQSQRLTHQVHLLRAAVEHHRGSTTFRDGAVGPPCHTVATERKVVLSQPPLHNCHGVGGQSPSLVAANRVCASHGLARGQHTDQTIVRHHALHGIGQRNGDGEGQPLWNGHHDEGNGHQQMVQKRGDAPCDGIWLLRRRRPSDNADDGLDGQHSECEHRRCQAQFADHLRQPAQLHLERGICGAATGGHGQLASERIDPHVDDQHQTLAFGNIGATNEERVVRRGLFHYIRLTGHCRLIAFQILPLEEHSISCHRHPRSNKHDVTNHQF
mmetsp:Transcript_18500/g.32067  ORF Transcript_18500/g.32067 Transcript_18500/m.32067 type:complete len:356 (-) Transcript_18500:633-1700(-)